MRKVSWCFEQFTCFWLQDSLYELLVSLIKVAITAYGEVDIEIHVFLDSKIVGDMFRILQACVINILINCYNLKNCVFWDITQCGS
jgi:hypothetical protein